MIALELAITFHEIYERLAPKYGYETRDDTKMFDPNSKNGRLMVAVCGEILDVLEDKGRVPMSAAVQTAITRMLGEWHFKERKLQEDISEAPRLPDRLDELQSEIKQLEVAQKGNWV